MSDGAVDVRCPFAGKKFLSQETVLVTGAVRGVGSTARTAISILLKQGHRAVFDPTDTFVQWMAADASAPILGLASLANRSRLGPEETPMLNRHSPAIAMLPFAGVVALGLISSPISRASDQGLATRTVGSTTTREITVQRLSRVTSKRFDEVVESLTKTIGRPDMSKFHKNLSAAKTAAALEEVVRRAIGPSGLMEFARYDSGAVLRLEGGGQGPKILRLMIGNPLIMQQMARSVPDAAAYAPLTILIDERADGVHLSYDSFSSLIAPYGSAGALAVAKDLDAKVEGLLDVAAR